MDVVSKTFIVSYSLPYFAVYNTHSHTTRRQFLEPKFEEKHFLGQF